MVRIKKRLKVIILTLAVTLLIFSIEYYFLLTTNKPSSHTFSVKGKLQGYGWTYIKINNKTYHVSDWFWPNVYSPPLWVKDLIGKEVCVVFECGCDRCMVVELKKL